MTLAQPVPRPTWRPRLVALLVAVAALVTDQLSKVWALANLDEGVRFDVLGSLLGLRLVRNPGAAFSLGASSTWVMTLVAGLLTCVLLVAMWRVSTWWIAVSVGLLTGGAIGNLVDRLVREPAPGRGHVIDFIDYSGFFVGNVADVWVVLGALMLAVWAMRTRTPRIEEGDERG